MFKLASSKFKNTLRNFTTKCDGNNTNNDDDDINIDLDDEVYFIYDSLIYLFSDIFTLSFSLSLSIYHIHILIEPYR